MSYCVICSEKTENINKFRLNIQYKSFEDILVGYCDKCQFGFQIEKTPNKIGVEYMDMRWKSNDDYVNENSLKTISRNNKYFEYIKQLELGSDVNLLDFGCGNGSFLSKIKRENKLKFKNLVGIEESNSAIEIVKKSGISVYSDLSEILFKFNLITMWDVIEHLYDLETTIKGLINILNHNGYLLLETANYDFNKIYLMTHYWYFTPKSVELLFNKFGRFEYNYFEKKPNIVVLIKKI